MINEPHFPGIKILHIIKTLGLGGAESNFYNLLKAMQMQKGIELHAAYAVGGEFEEPLRKLDIHLFKYGNVNVRVKDFRSLSIIARLASYWSAATRSLGWPRRTLARKGEAVFTRVAHTTHEMLRVELGEDVRWYPEARIATVGAEERERHGKVLVVTAGTSDIPIAEEAAVTCDILGCDADRLYDVGVAGVHRLTSNLKQFESADVIIVIAGMEGALPSVVAGLTDAPTFVKVRRLVLNDVGPVVTAASIARIGEFLGRAPRFATIEEAEAYQHMVEDFGLGQEAVALRVGKKRSTVTMRSVHTVCGHAYPHHMRPAIAVTRNRLRAASTSTPVM